MKTLNLKKLILCLAIPCFAIVFSGIVSVAAAEEPTAEVLVQSKKYKNSTVNSVDRIGADGDNAEVSFTDEDGNKHDAIVPWSSSLRRKLEKAEKSGDEVDITVNSDNQITGVR